MQLLTEKRVRQIVREEIVKAEEANRPYGIDVTATNCWVPDCKEREPHGHQQPIRSPDIRTAPTIDYDADTTN